MRRPLRWPVSDDPFTLLPIRWFDSWSEAVDFVHANLGTRNLYLGEPQYVKAKPYVEADPLSRRHAA